MSQRVYSDNLPKTYVVITNKFIDTLIDVGDTEK